MCYDDYYDITGKVLIVKLMQILYVVVAFEKDYATI